MRINILLPVLNEELRLKSGVERAVEYIRNNLTSEYQLTIVDNGSTDRTPQISKELSNKYPEVSCIRIEERGVGIAFKTGIERNTAEIVGYMDIDLSTDISHLKQVEEIFKSDANAEIVNASRYRKDADLVGRKWYRNMVSYVLVWILKIRLKMRSSDAICGFKFFKKDVVKMLINECTPENSWFFIIELLIRAEKNNCKIIEIPVRWINEEHTTVNVWKTSKNYLKGISRLKKNLKTKDSKSRK